MADELKAEVINAMSVVYLLLPISILLGCFFLGSFIWALRNGQFDDLKTPAQRIFFDEEGSKETSFTID